MASQPNKLKSCFSTGLRSWVKYKLFRHDRCPYCYCMAYFMWDVRIARILSLQLHSPKTFLMTAKTAALVIGIIFIAVGLLGFIDNPIVGDSEAAIFHADTVHNMVHIISGVLFVLVARAAPAFSSTFLVLFGIVYLAIGLVGFANFGGQGMGKVLGFLHVNGADNYLHIALGIVILLLGVITRRRVIA